MNIVDAERKRASALRHSLESLQDNYHLSFKIGPFELAIAAEFPHWCVFFSPSQTHTHTHSEFIPLVLESDIWLALRNRLILHSILAKVKFICVAQTLTHTHTQTHSAWHKHQSSQTNIKSFWERGHIGICLFYICLFSWGPRNEAAYSRHPLCFYLSPFSSSMAVRIWHPDWRPSGDAFHSISSFNGEDLISHLLETDIMINRK